MGAGVPGLREAGARVEGGTLSQFAGGWRPAQSAGPL